jgi:hypothetical protein
MGEVLIAEDTTLHRKVALKFLLSTQDERIGFAGSVSGNAVTQTKGIRSEYA